MQIRKAKPEDVNAITEILRSLGWYAHMETETHEETATRIAKRLAMCDADDSHSVYVASGDNGEILGYTAVHWMPTLYLRGIEGYVTGLFVRDTARGQGVGTKLLKTVKREAAERDCSRLMLINRHSRESYGRGFYRKCGWDEREGISVFAYRLP